MYSFQKENLNGGYETSQENREHERKSPHHFIEYSHVVRTLSNWRPNEAIHPIISIYIHMYIV